MNAINIINPYRWNNMWVFDDSSKELDKEPLVEGADTLLSMLTDQENAIITFSENKTSISTLLSCFRKNFFSCC